MNTATETYREWLITVTGEKNMCASFSFDITDPRGRRQHVAMGGENENRAFERAREMIDAEIALAEDD